jgi:ATP-dependent DNA ligase
MVQVGQAARPLFPGGARTVLARLADRRFVLDGELVIPDGGALSFDALQLRLHPAASRVRWLRETPGAADPVRLLFSKETKLLHAPFETRRRARSRSSTPREQHAGLLLSPCTEDREAAQKWLAEVGARSTGSSPSGSTNPIGRASGRCSRSSARTADCVVGGFRYAAGSREVGSLLLGLYDDGLLHHVGFTSSIAAAERAALTGGWRRWRGGRASPAISPAGRAAGRPSAPADWQPLKPELVVEVRYDHVTGAASATAPNSCAGGPTRRRSSAGWTSSSPRRGPRP